MQSRIAGYLNKPCLYSPWLNPPVYGARMHLASTLQWGRRCYTSSRRLGWPSTTPSLWGRSTLGCMTFPIKESRPFTFSEINSWKMNDFFWRSPTVPILMWKKSERKSLPEYLKELPKTAAHQNWYMTDDQVTKRFILTSLPCWLKVTCPHKEFYSKAGRLCRTCIHYMEHCIQKLAQGLGWFLQCCWWRCVAGHDMEEHDLRCPSQRGQHLLYTMRDDLLKHVNTTSSFGSVKLTLYQVLCLSILGVGLLHITLLVVYEGLQV